MPETGLEQIIAACRRLHLFLLLKAGAEKGQRRLFDIKASAARADLLALKKKLKNNILARRDDWPILEDVTPDSLFGRMACEQRLTLEQQRELLNDTMDAILSGSDAGGAELAMAVMEASSV